MVQVQGKVNTITLDECSKTGLVFQDLLASCEVVNCSSVQVQATGTVHTLAIDKSDGVQVRLRGLKWQCKFLQGLKEHALLQSGSLVPA